MDKAKDFHAKADHFATRAAHAKARTDRNTYLSLERAYRNLAVKQERFEAASREPTAVTGACQALLAARPS